ncbi:hypothetical protein [Arthrobacter sp. H16F315]|uniref:hypothetical protein n=1 Tax=Arthrobacter sp. H16F315 TaxID=2955314 RepID=UPI002097C926|nr:hypothetical protein [Arthrobacter sp. H16F315]MDD1475427.1 hypothetical protein [Arthrobacter sp. H16F315]
MGLSNVLARAAVSRCHVFLAEVVDGAGPRMAVEQELTRRGWVEALSPADADIFCVCGDVPDGQAKALDRLWDQLPGPRARVSVSQSDDAGAQLDGCVAELLDTAAQRRQGADRTVQPDDGGKDDGGMDDMDHGGMDMPMPGGIPLAGEGTDRDGLDLDVLKVPLGPYLPLWPAGLVLHCELQGDVVFGATVGFEFGQSRSGPGQPAADEPATLIHHLDLASRLLRLAGAVTSAGRTRRIRDAALDGAALDRCRTELRAELGRLRKDWLLHRALRGIGHVPADAGLPADSGPQGLAGTDVWTRLLGMFEAAAGSTAPATSPSTLQRQDFAAALPRLVRGQELSVLRLIVASFDLAPAAQQTTAQQTEVSR